jgi:hypothetical protein
MASALASTVINGDPSRYAKAMGSPLSDCWKRAIDEESVAILLSNTFTTVNSKHAKLLLVKPVDSRWVLKNKRNPDGSTSYKARLVIKTYGQTDSGEIYALVGKLRTFRNLISLVGRCGWNIDHFNVVNAFHNTDVDDDEIYMALPEGWPQGHDDTCTYALPIIVRLRMLSMASSKHPGSGITISTPSSSPSGSHSPKPILTLISTPMALSSFCKPMASP